MGDYSKGPPALLRLGTGLEGYTLRGSNISFDSSNNWYTVATPEPPSSANGTIFYQLLTICSAKAKGTESSCTASGGTVIGYVVIIWQVYYGDWAICNNSAYVIELPGKPSLGLDGIRIKGVRQPLYVLATTGKKSIPSVGTYTMPCEVDNTLSNLVIYPPNVTLNVQSYKMYKNKNGLTGPVASPVPFDFSFVGTMVFGEFAIDEQMSSHFPFTLSSSSWSKTTQVFPYFQFGGARLTDTSGRINTLPTIGGFPSTPTFDISCGKWPCYKDGNPIPLDKTIQFDVIFWYTSEDATEPLAWYLSAPHFSTVTPNYSNLKWDSSCECDWTKSVIDKSTNTFYPNNCPTQSYGGGCNPAFYPFRYLGLTLEPFPSTQKLK